jgi:hypothetical protein
MSAARCKFALPGMLTLFAMIGLALSLALPCIAQNPGGSTGTNTGGPTHSMRDIYTDPSESSGLPMGDPVFQERRLRQLAMATHKSMVSDSDKLLELVTELSSEISTTNPATFTPEQLRKIAQIEKLAHSVKEKMGNTLQGAPVNVMETPDPPVFRH